jgi:hypothetical protein
MINTLSKHVIFIGDTRVTLSSKNVDVYCCTVLNLDKTNNIVCNE